MSTSKWWVIFGMAIAFYLPSYCPAAALTSLIVTLGEGSPKRHTVKLAGYIFPGDADKFEAAINPILHPNYVNVETRGHITLLLDSPGGDYNEALRIAQIVRDQKISTKVERRSFCNSACAFIFMAGSLQQYAMDAEVDRAIEAGAELGFHSPYIDGSPGSFQQGIDALAMLSRVLGDGLPRDLYEKLLAVKKDKFLYLNYIYEAIEWNINILGYKNPSHSRGDFLNACLNNSRKNFATWPLGNLSWYDPTSQQGWDPANAYLLDENEIPVADKWGNPILKVDIPLPSEGSDDIVEMRRTALNSNLMKEFRHNNGKRGVQFQFDNQDELGVFWCTAWINEADDGEVVISRSEIDPLHIASPRRSLGTVDLVPSWFEFAPGMRIKQIAER